MIYKTKGSLFWRAMSRHKTEVSVFSFPGTYVVCHGLAFLHTVCQASTNVSPSSEQCLNLHSRFTKHWCVHNVIWRGWGKPVPLVLTMAKHSTFTTCPFSIQLNLMHVICRDTFSVDVDLPKIPPFSRNPGLTIPETWEFWERYPYILQPTLWQFYKQIPPQSNNYLSCSRPNVTAYHFILYSTCSKSYK